MPYCFHCNKEVKDIDECPECGRDLLPDVNFVERDETNEEMFLKEIRRKKLEEAHERGRNNKIYKDFESSIEDKIPNNYTSVRPNTKYRKKE